LPTPECHFQTAPDYGGARSISDELERATYSHYGLAARQTAGVPG
jgi:hypothetical protein